jgi:hypothetical protein
MFDFNDCYWRSYSENPQTDSQTSVQETRGSVRFLFSLLHVVAFSYYLHSQLNLLSDVCRVLVVRRWRSSRRRRTPNLPRCFLTCCNQSCEMNKYLLLPLLVLVLVVVLRFILYIHHPCGFVMCAWTTFRLALKPVSMMTRATCSTPLSLASGPLSVHSCDALLPCIGRLQMQFNQGMTCSKSDVFPFLSFPPLLFDCVISNWLWFCGCCLIALVMKIQLSWHAKSNNSRNESNFSSIMLKELNKSRFYAEFSGFA